MNKPAPASVPLEPYIVERWSPYAFADRPVEPAKLRQLMEAARWAPSSYNEQPWSFLVATQDQAQAHARLVACLAEGNVPWAQHAPVLMLSVASERFARNNKPNRHYFHDVGLAMGNVLVQAHALGLYVHQMAGFEPDKARQELGIPEGQDPVAMIAIGYYGQRERLPEAYQQRDDAPRSRKPLEAFVFTGGWGQTPNWVEGE